MSKPVCTECEGLGKRYSVTQGMSSTTLMGWPSPYWDEDGKYIVSPNPNTTTTQYACSNGHVWSARS